MKSLVNTIASIVSMLACVGIVILAVPQFKERVVGSAPGSSGAQPVKDLRLSLPSIAVKGSASAKVVLIEFSDFQCPYCGLWARSTSTQLQKELVDSGKILYAFRNFPMTEIHPFAMKAGQAAMCAGAQNKFWPMHDLLFADQKALSENDLERRASTLSLDAPTFSRCLESRSVAMTEDMAEAQRAGIESTPTFIVGFVERNGAVTAT